MASSYKIKILELWFEIINKTTEQSKIMLNNDARGWTKIMNKTTRHSKIMINNDATGWAKIILAKLQGEQKLY